MSARDIFHEAVTQALEKEQWVITDDPLKFQFGNVKFRIDLAAERIVAAEKGDEKIAIEIKSFLNPSAITDFYAALGQFLSYRLALAETQPERVLYARSTNRCIQNLLSIRVYANSCKTIPAIANCIRPSK